MKKTANSIPALQQQGHHAESATCMPQSDEIQTQQGPCMECILAFCSSKKGLAGLEGMLSHQWQCVRTCELVNMLHDWHMYGCSDSYVVQSSGQRAQSYQQPATGRSCWQSGDVAPLHVVRLPQPNVV
jgi:hypothetical protein